MSGGRIQKIPLLAGHQWPTSVTSFKLRFAGVLMMAQHWMLAWIRTSNAKKPHILWFSRGGGPDPLPPSGSSHDCQTRKDTKNYITKDMDKHKDSTDNGSNTKQSNNNRITTLERIVSGVGGSERIAVAATATRGFTLSSMNIHAKSHPQWILIIKSNQKIYSN